MQETIDKLKKKGFDNERFERWLEEPFVKMTYDTVALKAAWYGNEVIEQEKETLEAISEHDIFSDMDKNELDQYAIDTYGIDLDKRFSKQNMIEELKEELKKQNEE
jgi:hypothetical protein